MYPDFLELLRVFESHKVEYVLIGGYAVGFYAEPRYTKDIDFLVRPSKSNAEALLAALSEFGAPVDNLTIKDLATPGLIYVFGISPLRVDIINRIKEVDVRKIIKGSKVVMLSGVSVRIVGLDDLIMLKTLANRAQDKADIKKLKEVQKRETQKKDPPVRRAR